MKVKQYTVALSAAESHKARVKEFALLGLSGSEAILRLLIGESQVCWNVFL